MRRGNRIPLASHLQTRGERGSVRFAARDKDATQSGAGGRRCGGQRGVLCIDDRCGEATIAEHVLELMAGAAVVDVDRDGARQHAAQQLLAVGRRVEQVQADCLARLQACADQIPAIWSARLTTRL